MIIEDKFVIAAPIQEVWDFFLDIERLSKCVPGVEHVDQTSDTTYEGALSAKVGPIKATFGGTAEITEQNEPSFISADIKAKDKRTASLIKGGFSSTLTALEENKTEVGYTIDVAIRGKMGQFGQTVIQDTSKNISKIFVNNVREELEKNAEEEVESADSASSTTTAKNDVQQPNLVWVVIKSVFGSIGRSITNLFSK